MITIDRQIYKQYKDGEISTQGLADYLLRTFPVTEIALALAETVAFDAEFKPITLTQEEFNLHFRIRGIKPNGEKEKRGRPKTDVQP